ncbi:hypothetical protein BC827DRAFT_1251005, partial [Russula dissimulans]
MLGSVYALRTAVAKNIQSGREKRVRTFASTTTSCTRLNEGRLVRRHGKWGSDVKSGSGTTFNFTLKYVQGRFRSGVRLALARVWAVQYVASVSSGVYWKTLT